MAPARISFDYTPFGQPVTWVAGVLVASDDRSAFSAFGSGFLAAPDLAFTARHVVDEISERFTGRPIHELTGQMPFGVQLATSDPSTGKFLKWDVTNYHYSRNIDITGLTIEPAEDLGQDFLMVLPRFDISPPPEGAAITAFGYPNTTSRQFGDGSYRVKLCPTTSRGVVREIHYQYRDRVMLPFPCMHTNARFDAGMSGGPVFNQDGRVCAVVATGMETAREDGGHDSHASLIWPAFGLRFNDGQATGQQNPPRFLRSDAEAGQIQVLNLDYMSVEPSPDNCDRLRYAPPGPTPLN
jgi:hypothetical protein